MNALWNFKRDAHRFWLMLSDSQLSRSYHVDEPRKSKFEIFIDLLRWWVRYGELNAYYYFYGLDRTQGDATRFLPYKHFRRIRDAWNQNGAGGDGFSYICLVRDKYVFGQFIRSLGLPTPLNVALCRRDTLTWLDGRGESDWDSVLDVQGEFFCKKITGMSADNAFPLRVTNRRIYIADRESSVAALRERLDGTYLLQQRIAQHEAMSRLHPASVNALRIVTFNVRGRVRVFWAALMVGTSGRHVDSIGDGGVAVRVDHDSGRLVGSGIYLPGRGTTAECHPDTGIRFDGFVIPYFKEAIACATAAHERLYGVHSIGWDIAITLKGPTLVEGNDDWAGHVAMALIPNFRERFLAMYEPDAR